MSRRRGGIVVGWVLGIVIAGLVALLQRSEFATLRPAGVVFLVLFTAPAALLAVTLVRPPVVLGLTVAAAGGWSITTAYLVMIDQSSTAGIGVVSTPAVTVLIVASGVGVDRLLRTKAHGASAPG